MEKELGVGYQSKHSTHRKPEGPGSGKGPEAEKTNRKHRPVLHLRRTRLVMIHCCVHSDARGHTKVILLNAAASGVPRTQFLSYFMPGNLGISISFIIHHCRVHISVNTANC